MFWKLSLFNSLAAAAVSAYFIVVVTEDWGPSPFAAVLVLAVVAALLIGPHLVLGLLAVAVRSRTILSGPRPACVVPISVLGAVFLLQESREFLNRDQTVPAEFNWESIALGTAQWGASLLLSFIILPLFRYLQKDAKGKDRQAICLRELIAWPVKCH